MAIEWGFLILLAVGAAIADLRPLLIVLVMAAGWLLVVLVELLAWRARPEYAVTEAETVEAPGPAAPAGPAPPLYEEPVYEQPVVEEPVYEEPAAAAAPAYDFEFRRPEGAAEPSGAAAEESTGVVAPDEQPVSEPAAVFGAPETDRAALDADDPFAPAPEREHLRRGDQRVVHRLEPLKPRPRRRWFGGAGRRSQGDAEGSGGEGR
jgi:hypothetical protein